MTTTRTVATPVQLFDDERVRVTRLEFPPGAETGWHRHEYDYVIVATSDCEMLVEEKDGSTRTATVLHGEAYRRSAGVEHNVINNGEGRMVFIEVELK